MADRFALVAVAGELATSWGITGWGEGAATEAAGKCFSAWLCARGGDGTHEDDAMLRQVRGYLEQKGASEFDLFHRLHDDHAPRTANRAGVVRWLYQDGTPIDKEADKCEEFRRADYLAEFYVYPEAWRRVCKGFDHEAVARLMASRGYLECDKGRFSRKFKIPGMGRLRVYHIKTSFLEGKEPQNDCPFGRLCEDCSEECPTRKGHFRPTRPTS